MLHQKNSSIMKKVIFSLTTLCLLFSCSKITDPIISGTTRPDTVHFRSVPSGEELYKGIYFLQQDFTDEIPSLASLKSQMATMIPNGQTAQYSAVMAVVSQEVTDFISTNYPTFFSEFKAALTSGDLYQMREYLASGANKLMEAGTSGSYGALFENQAIISSPEFYDYLSSLDLNTTEGQTQLQNYLGSIGYTGGGGGTEICCLPGTLVCVVYIAVLAHSYVAVTVTAVALAIAWVEIGVFDVSYAGNAPNIEQLCSELEYYLTTGI
jgi:hypothetical protein